MAFMGRKLSILFISTVLAFNCSISKAWYLRDFLLSISGVLMSSKALVEMPDLIGNNEEKENKAKEDFCIAAILDVVWAISKSCQNVENDLKSKDKNAKLKLDKKS